MKKLRNLLALLFAFALIAAACSDDNTNEDNGASTETTEASADEASADDDIVEDACDEESHGFVWTCPTDREVGEATVDEVEIDCVWKSVTIKDDVLELAPEELGAQLAVVIRTAADPEPVVDEVKVFPTYDEKFDVAIPPGMRFWVEASNESGKESCVKTLFLPFLPKQVDNPFTKGRIDVGATDLVVGAEVTIEIAGEHECIYDEDRNQEGVGVYEGTISIARVVHFDHGSPIVNDAFHPAHEGFVVEHYNGEFCPFTFEEAGIVEPNDGWDEFRLTTIITTSAS